MPGDTRSDLDIIFDIAEKDPDSLRYPDFKADYDKARFELNPPSTSDYVRQAIGSGVRSFASGFASIPESIGILSAELNRKVGNLDVIGDGDPTDPHQRLAFQLGQLIRKAGEAIAPEPVESLQDKFLATKVPGYAGSAASFLVGGAAGKLLTGASALERAALKVGADSALMSAAELATEKGVETALKYAPTSLKLSSWIAGNSPIALQGALSQATDAYNDAISKGASRDSALQNYLWSLPIGASEIVPLGKMLHRLDGISAGKFSTYLVEAGKESFEEAAQEASQQFAQNYVAQKLYDKDRSLFQDLTENAAGGGIVGFLLSTLTHAVGAARGRTLPQGGPTIDASKRSPLPPGVIPGETPPPVQPPAPAGPSGAPAPGIDPTIARDYAAIPPEQQLVINTLAGKQAAGEELDAGELALLNTLSPQQHNALTLARDMAEKQMAQAKVDAAAAQTDPDPTDAQKESGTYKKGHVTVDGMDISIENEVGSTRSGKDADGNEWSVTMPAHYGYIKGTTGKDKDHLDIYLGPDVGSDTVVVVNQSNPDTGAFDEHKILYGFATKEDALKAYDAAFSDGSGPERRGQLTNTSAQGVAVMSKEEFKDWLKNGDHTVPLKQANIPAPPRATDKQLFPQQPAPVVPTAVPQALPTAVPTVSPPPVVQAVAQPVVAPPAVPIPSATRVHTGTVPTAAVDPVSLIDEQRPEFRSGLEKLTREDLNAAVVSSARPANVVEGTKTEENKKRKPKDSLTHQVTFFLDKKTGEVFGLGTYTAPKRGEGRVPWVGRHPDLASGTTLKTFLDGGKVGIGVKNATVDPGRFVPVATVRLTNAIDSTQLQNAIRFDNVQAYNRFFAEAQTLQDKSSSYESAEAGFEGGTEATGGGTAVPVQTVTPADELVASESESFTVDDGRALYRALRAVRMTEVAGRLTPLARKKIWQAIIASTEGMEAAKRAIVAFTPEFLKLSDGDPVPAARLATFTMEEYIHDAKSLHPKSEKGFAERISQEINRRTSDHAAQGGDTAAAVTPASAGSEGASGTTGAEPATTGAGGPGTTGGTASQTNVGDALSAALDQANVRLHTAPGGLSGADTSTLFRNTLQAAGQAGLQVTLLRAETEAAANELGGTFGIRNGRPVAVVAVANASAPTVENLYVLNAEVAHAVFAGLPVEQQEKLQTAISGATEGMLGSDGKGGNISVHPSIPVSQRAAVMQEERLVDAVAKSITEQGFNPAEAKSLAQRFWRLLKAAVLRAAMAVQRAWFGISGQQSGGISSRLATAYFETRVKSWLAGDSRPMSFTDYMGGGKQTTQDNARASRFPLSSGEGMTFQWNPTTFQMEVQTVTASDAASFQYNLDNASIRYHKPTGRNAAPETSPDIGPEQYLPRIASMNEVDVTLQQVFADWTANGNNSTTTGQPLMTFEQFSEWVRPHGVGHAPTTIAEWNAAIAKAGQAPQNPDTRLTDLNEDAAREGSWFSFDILSKIKNAWQNRRQEADEAFDPHNPRSSQSKFNKAAFRIVNLTRNYTDATFILSEVQARVAAWVEYARDNAKNIGSLSYKKGVIEQVIEDIEGRLDAPLVKQYADVIDKLFRKYASDATHGTSLVAMLQKLANLDVPWQDMSVREIKDLLRSTSVLPSVAVPDLDPIQANTPEGRALLSITAGFLKTDGLMTAMLALRADTLHYADRAQVNDALKAALGDSRVAASEALKGIPRGNKLLKRAEKILAELDSAKEKQRQLLDYLEDQRRFIDMHVDALPILNARIAAMEKLQGAAPLMFEPTYGCQMFVPANPNQKPEFWTKKVFQHERDGTLDDQLRRDIAMMDAWIAANPEGSGWHNYLSQQAAKLKENDVSGMATKNVRRVMQTIFGPMTVLLNQTGMPSLKAVSRQLNDWLRIHDTYRKTGERMAHDFTIAENKARKELGYSKWQIRKFRDRWQAGQAYFERRTDLLYGAPTSAEGYNRRIEATLDYLGLTGKQRDAMEAVYRTAHNVNEELAAIGERESVKIYDDDAQIFRNVRGAKGEMMRKLSGSIDLTLRQMVGEANNPGRWAANPLKLKPDGSPRDTAAEYTADPNALRASLAPLFEGDVWSYFVSEIAHNPGRSSFLGAPDAGGFAQLASVEQVAQAFDGAPVGDVVAFAERLHALTGGTPANRAAFVAETLDTLHNLFSDVRSQFQQRSAIARYTIEPVQELLMNARKSDTFPPGFFEYRTFDLKGTKSVINHLAFHASFGRNMTRVEGDFAKGIEELQKLENILVRETQRASAAGKTTKQLRAEVGAAVKALGYDLTELENASKNLATVKAQQKNFQNFVNSQGGVAFEFKAWSEMMSAFVAMVLQGPATAAIDTISLMKPTQLLPLSSQSLAWTRWNYKYSIFSGAGTLLELLGRTIRDEGGWIQQTHEHGVIDTAAQHTLRERMIATNLNSPLREGASMSERIQHTFATLGRNIREVIRTPLPARAENRLHPGFKPAGVFGQTTEHMTVGGTIGTWRVFSDMATRAATWITKPENVAALEDPTFRFTKDHAQALGYGNKFFGLLQNEKAFEQMLSMLNEYGMTLEGLAREWISRGMTGPALSNKSLGKLLPIWPSEGLQEGSITSRPSWMVTNPLAHAALPLVGWSFAQAGAVQRSFYPRFGEGDWKTFKNGLLSFAAITSVGLMYALMRDIYDEDILKKKSNHLTLTGDNPGLALIDRMSQVGSLGIVGDFANSMFNQSTGRDFSIDSRVFAVSSFFNLYRAVGAWWNQGAATYATVGRPILQSFGGTGYLNYVQMINNLTGAVGGFHLPGFEAEARMTARINANNWLRVYGRDADLDVRSVSSGGNGLAAPSRTRPWVTEMAMAAFANNGDDFREAYRRAVQAAKDDGRPDPKDYIARAFQSMNPLRTVFKTPISEREYRILLNSMPEDGRRDVTEAVRLFNRFGERLGLQAFEGKPTPTPMQENTAMLKRLGIGNIQDILRREAGVRLPSLSGY